MGGQADHECEAEESEDDSEVADDVGDVEEDIAGCCSVVGRHSCYCVYLVTVFFGCDCLSASSSLLPRGGVR